MATTQISPEEYLRESYEPDCDYVDGKLRERNWGEYEHGFAQLFLGGCFYSTVASGSSTPPANGGFGFRRLGLESPMSV